jgi:sugar lactone lactonase YvrE
MRTTKLQLLGVLFILIFYSYAVSGSDIYSYVGQWGSGGSEDGQFKSPDIIAVDSTGNVYVHDDYNRIQKFTSDGVFITKWEGQGKEPNYITGIAFDRDGNVIVSVLYRIQKFSPDGTLIEEWGTMGEGDGEFVGIDDIAVDNTGNIYVADGSDCVRGMIHCKDNIARIQIFDPHGRFVTKWGKAGNFEWDLQVFLKGIEIDSAGNVFVVSNDNIKKYSGSGEYHNDWGGGPQSGFFHEFETLEGISVDKAGYIYTVDSGDSDNIKKFTSEGTRISSFGKYGTGNGEFNHPRSIAVDNDGNIYVADTGNHRIQKFTLDRHVESGEEPVVSFIFFIVALGIVMVLSREK